VGAARTRDVGVVDAVVLVACVVGPLVVVVAPCGAEVVGEALAVVSGTPPGGWIEVGGVYTVGGGALTVTVNARRAWTGAPLASVCDAITGAWGGRVVSGTWTYVVNRPSASTATSFSTISVPIMIVTALHGDGQKPAPVTLIVASGGPEDGSIASPGIADADAGALDTTTIATATTAVSKARMKRRTAPGCPGAVRLIV
jgi:hypothetical protein